MLERVQKGTLEVTDWLSWFLGALGRAIASAQGALGRHAGQGAFLATLGGHANERAAGETAHRLLDGFAGRLTSSKWAADAALAMRYPEPIILNFQAAILALAEKRFSRTLTASERSFIASREGLLALEAIHDTVAALSGSQLEKYLRQEAEKQ